MCPFAAAMCSRLFPDWGSIAERIIALSWGWEGRVLCRVVSSVRRSAVELVRER